MSLFEANLADLAGAFLGFTLTLFVFSYAWGENPLFRIATHLFVGVAAGYTTIITIYHIILPHLIIPFINGSREEMILAIIYLIPSVLILTKISPRLSRIGTPAMAILVGIGAAAAVGGSVFGTIFPQVLALTQVYERQNFVNAGIILLGTLTTLIYFNFGARKKSSDVPVGQVVQSIGWIGQIFIAITFGALFAGVYFASLAALIERLSSIWTFLQRILGIVLPG